MSKRCWLKYEHKSDVVAQWYLSLPRRRLRLASSSSRRAHPTTTTTTSSRLQPHPPTPAPPHPPPPSPTPSRSPPSTPTLRQTLPPFSLLLQKFSIVLRVLRHFLMPDDQIIGHHLSHRQAYIGQGCESGSALRMRVRIQEVKRRRIFTIAVNMNQR